jgi:hypothetical protein
VLSIVPDSGSLPGRIGMGVLSFPPPGIPYRGSGGSDRHLRRDAVKKWGIAPDWREGYDQTPECRPVGPCHHRFWIRLAA